MAASSAATSPRKPSSMRRLPSTTIDGRLKSFNCGYRATRSFISGMSWLSPAPWTTIARSPDGGARSGGSRVASTQSSIGHAICGKPGKK